MFFDDLDFAIARELGVPVEEYIEKIESTTYKRAEIIIDTIFLSEDEKKIEKAKRIFNMIKL